MVQLKASVSEAFTAVVRLRLVLYTICLDEFSIKADKRKDMYGMLLKVEDVELCERI